MAFSSPRSIGAEVSFEREVMPILSRTGCNAGACHGNLNGKGGFKLSLKGEDPAADLAALTHDMLARRISPAHAEESLMLLKATGRVPHEGGVRFSTNSREYRILQSWISRGGTADFAGVPALLKLEVTPASKILIDPAGRFAVTAIAHFSDGTTRDVTHLAAFEFTSVGIASIAGSGEVVRESTGECVLLVRYLSELVPVRIVFLPNRPIPENSLAPAATEIDRLVHAQLQELRLKAADLASDSTFLRRAYLDAIGMLPTVSEAKAFFADEALDKRKKLIDQLLERPEFAEF
jgi:hypothetical protein